jgi:hypothetical protein
MNSQVQLLLFEDSDKESFLRGEEKTHHFCLKTGIFLLGSQFDCEYKCSSKINIPILNVKMRWLTKSVINKRLSK